MQIKQQFKNLVGLAVLLTGISIVAHGQQQPATQERVAQFKKALQQSQQQLRRYEWIETTTVTLKGEVKSQKQNRCYYGADGKIQKVPVGDTSQQQQQPQGRGGRLRGRIIAKKKEEMTDYMQRAVSLIHRYVPPEPEMIQFAKDNGKASYDVFEPNKVIRLSLQDIIQTGDLMSATLNIQSNAILDLKVSTYLDSPQEDAVILNVIFARLPDGTSYSGQTTLDAKAKNIRVIVENTGHRRMN